MLRFVMMIILAHWKLWKYFMSKLVSKRKKVSPTKFTKYKVDPTIAKELSKLTAK